MSSMNYNNYNNQLPLQSITTAPPPVQRYMNNQRRGGTVYRNKQYNYEYSNSIPNRNYNNDFYSLQNNTDNNFSNRQNNNNNIFYNRNFQQRHKRYSMNNDSMESYYNYNNRPPIFQTASHNTTQSFTVNVDTNDLDQQQQSSQHRPTTNTSTRRCQQRRNRQEQYRNTADSDNNYNYNRFNDLTEADANTDIESNYDDVMNNDAAPIINKNKNNNKKMKIFYLEPNRIMRYMQDSASPIFSSRGNQAYILASTTIYDDWIRNNYDLQVWQNYLKMGTNDKHWAKEVIKGTKIRDDIINSRFVKKKINRFTTNITQASANISNLQIQLTTYWTQTITNGITSTTPAATTLESLLKDYKSLY
ncbi:unnamed protein product [Rotaria socialis]|uniref:Uncharacterized protein n=1 Tax=Rotaria socialis TaxID=392032 RepID=A0A818UMT1_9BILA|nr:unnamed protein product [Rotaria socialis]CAF4599332.1 unnamed protein product [Rotaria socialis]